MQKRDGTEKEGERALARRWMYHYTPVIITFSFFFVLMTTTISYCFTIFYFARILLPLKERGSPLKKNVLSPPTRGVNITAPKSDYDEHARVHVFSFQRVAL